MSPAGNTGTAALIAGAEAVAGALAPLAGPYVILAETVLTQGLAFWQNFQAQKEAGTLTMADVDAAAAKVGVDLAQLKADIDAAG